MSSRVLNPKKLFLRFLLRFHPLLSLALLWVGRPGGSASRILRGPTCTRLVPNFRLTSTHVPINPSSTVTRVTSKSQIRPHMYIANESGQEKVFTNDQKGTPATSKHQNEAFGTTFQSTKTIRGPSKGVGATFEKIQKNIDFRSAEWTYH